MRSEMSFEVRDRDLLGRIGRLRTRSGMIETPALMPVVNPVEQPIPPREMKDRFNCQILITNAYIIKRRFGEEALKVGVHGLLDYDGVVMTDSGGYQVLVYGDVEVSPEEILEYQEALGSDIAVILDYPTGWGVSRRRAEWTVEVTLRRAEEAIERIKGSEALWVGPVQGGGYLDLVEYSAKRLAALPFQIYALGSPTQVMERYLFPFLVDMIMAARRNLPPDRPFHLFGAGHPFMFALAVALGCDLFDSAAYALYARDDRYLLPYGTRRLEELGYLPCSCPVCRGRDVEDLREMPRVMRRRFLAEHNLYVSMAEVDRVKQAMREGTLWELLEVRCRSHPALTSALRHLTKYRDDLERGAPSFKGRGLFYYDSASLSRPEVTRHRKRLLQNYRPPPEADTLLLLPAPGRRPYNSAPECRRLLRRLGDTLGEGRRRVHVCFYAPPFGVTPLELSETYPLSQFEISLPPDAGTLDYVAEQVGDYLSTGQYRRVFLQDDPGTYGDRLRRACERACEEVGAQLLPSPGTAPWSPKAIDWLMRRLREALFDPDPSPRCFRTQSSR
ncbi:tRNA guanosine(15) transglycosylase TgtA [Candidatus Bathyarchaeota archaeon]|nr:MAG: tRNA guanosine(15) transglycosylase TgtA [Candidatus Bathyarchaeota archaeon]